MKILHITNDYCGSKVHSRLCAELDKLGAEQTVYTHFEDSRKVGANAIDSPKMQVIYDPILKKIHHYLFHLRVNQIYPSMKKKLGIEHFDCCYASTLFSDGALAYRWHKETGTPYVVAVRKTDVYRFLRLGPHTWPMGKKILQHAEKVVFISQALQDAFCQHSMIRRMLPEIEQKFVILSNGIEDFWIDNRNDSHADACNVVYVGKFDANKNVARLIEAVTRLKSEIPNIHLDLVGGTGPQHDAILKMTAEQPETIHYHGQVFERPKLQEIYSRNAVFAMPSINETFGLVYLEAMTQGLTILCSKGQGIDGLFEQKVGEFVEPNSADAIAEGLRNLITKRGEYDCHIDFEPFRWSTIAHRYMNIFSESKYPRV